MVTLNTLINQNSTTSNTVKRTLVRFLKLSPLLFATRQTQAFTPTSWNGPEFIRGLTQSKANHLPYVSPIYADNRDFSENADQSSDNIQSMIDDFHAKSKKLQETPKGDTLYHRRLEQSVTQAMKLSQQVILLSHFGDLALTTQDSPITEETISHLGQLINTVAETPHHGDQFSQLLHAKFCCQRFAFTVGYLTAEDYLNECSSDLIQVIKRLRMFTSLPLNDYESFTHNMDNISKNYNLNPACRFQIV